ncbi:hypothetical protein [Nonomuraea wenchangensis]|uniref:Uncharacterized protein n=1 Tax=Nonomuraea wenchangensis TaxID=568860 RepID=A0A1I0EYH9_9ACTN|nr:hypothetical protein [Nonomuraea wenchangensis]SET50006.1 hypothetical protein SAMN05421811_103237 [Nonomuraea wenchangensis]
MTALDALYQLVAEGKHIPLPCSGIHTESRRPCQMPAKRLLVAGCVHEHLGLFLICAGHDAEQDQNCHECWAAGHECDMAEIVNPPVDVEAWLADLISPADPEGVDMAEWREFVRAHLHDLVPARLRTLNATCDSCERCTWNPGPDCGKGDHPHCPRCGHCTYRHTEQTAETGAAS